MSDSDGIQISDKASWEHTGWELWVILAKRLISLPSKMLGFKPFCLYLATWLLMQGLIRDWIWFAVMVMVLFGIVGLKVIARTGSRNEEGGSRNGGFLAGGSYGGGGGTAGGGDSGCGDPAPGAGSGNYGAMGG
ncbi:hypothetical protein LQZ19_07385 [Treponema primitia]|uniref:hypothetical protein n=1 Tax=Treponema primitia TaxID=88058 RepID=UPI003980D4A3